MVTKELIRWWKNIPWKRDKGIKPLMLILWLFKGNRALLILQKGKIWSIIVLMIIKIRFGKISKDLSFNYQSQLIEMVKKISLIKISTRWVQFSWELRSKIYIKPGMLKDFQRSMGMLVINLVKKRFLRTGCAGLLTFCYSN